jgi:hypothetical protein
LLWKEKPDYDPGLFHGILDTEKEKLTNITRVSDNNPFIDNGKVIVRTNGEIQVFWASDQAIYWTKWVGTCWDTARQVASTGWLSYPWFDLGYRAFYCFDVVEANDSSIDLVWSDFNSGKLMHKRYSGTWRQAISIDSINSRWIDDKLMGSKLIRDTHNITHLVYWKIRSDSSHNYLLHRYFDGVQWTSPSMLDDNTEPTCPNLVHGGGNSIFLVWQRNVDDHTSLSWRQYSGGVWSTMQVVPTTFGVDVHNPTTMFKNNNLIIAWSALSDSFATIDYTSISTAVNISDHEMKVPRLFMLKQNYPNPFNPSTTIRYELPQKSRVVLKILNILGQEVVTLVDEVKQPDRYSVQWNAGNAATGVYFYRIQAGEFVETKKLVLLK